MITDLASSMVRFPYVSEPSLSIRGALEMMRELDFRHLPIIEKGNLVGVVSERDLREAAQLPMAEKLRLEDVMKRNVFAVLKDTSLREVVMEMADRKVGSVVVMNSQKQVVGIFTTTDALRVLGDILSDFEEEDVLLSEDLYESWEELEEPTISGSF